MGMHDMGMHDMGMQGSGEGGPFAEQDLSVLPGKMEWNAWVQRICGRTSVSNASWTARANFPGEKGLWMKW